MKSIFTVFTLIAAFLLASPVTSHAEKKKADEAASDSAKEKHYPLYGELISISNTELVIKGGKGKPDRKFVITKDTKIEKDKKPVSIKEAKIGQWVGGYVLKTGSKSGDELVSLNFSAKQKEEKKEEKAASNTAATKTNPAAVDTPKADTTKTDDTTTTTKKKKKKKTDTTTTPPATTTPTN